MSRDEFAWMVVRALGIVTLWLLLIKIIGVLFYIPAVFTINRTHLPKAVQNADLLYDLLRFGGELVVECIVYSCLTYYLLKKGQYIHHLILKNIPGSFDADQ